MWVHNGCSFITESQYVSWKIQTVRGIAQNVTFSTFPILFFFDEQLNLETQNRFGKGKGKGARSLMAVAAMGC